MTQILVFRFQLVNTLAHAIVNLLEIRLILQKLYLLANHILIISHGWSGLGFLRSHPVNLGGSFVDERKHHVERDAMLLQKFLACGVAMIGEIAGEDRREMQIFPIFAGKLIHPMAYLACQALYLLQRKLIIASIKQGMMLKSTSRCFENVCIG